MNTPIERFTSTIAIAGLLFMAPLMAMARMTAPTIPNHQPPGQKRITSNAANPLLPAGEAETGEAGQ
jgi:hypothetical protein